MSAKLASRGRQARAPKAPSSRDEQIYARYNYEGRRQAELAIDYGLSQGRISEIIRRVEKWLGRADAVHQASESSQLRLARQVQEERLSLACREAIRSYFAPQTVVTKKSGSRGETAFNEQTERTSPPNIQCLKVLLSAARELRHLSEAVAVPPQEQTERNRRRIMQEEIFRLWKEAMQAGKTPNVIDPSVLIERWLDALLGEPNDSPCPDFALKALSDAIYPAGAAKPDPASDDAGDNPPASNQGQPQETHQAPQPNSPRTILTGGPTTNIATIPGTDILWQIQPVTALTSINPAQRKFADPQYPFTS